MDDKYLLFCLGAIKASKQPDEPIDKPYRKLKVDDMPIFDKVKKYDYNDLLKKYMLDKSKELKPVNSKVPVPESITCPCYLKKNLTPLKCVIFTEHLILTLSLYLGFHPLKVLLLYLNFMPLIMFLVLS
ncbi:MAG: hypothetical protein GT601_18475 [Acidaminobacter sp.]|nr:hypothetical protein [Acidaminobacter sp.]